MGEDYLSNLAVERIGSCLALVASALTEWTASLEPHTGATSLELRHGDYLISTYSCCLYHFLLFIFFLLLLSRSMLYGRCHSRHVSLNEDNQHPAYRGSAIVG
jgi:hypothetical protein